jgi:2-C-methyl-D-erythritol 4-phosphate cytidylyltransferase
MLESKYVIIVAGGSGNRMQSDVPKQFLLLNGKPVLMHTIERYNDTIPEIQCILVLPVTQISYWNNLCEQYKFELPHKIIVGGVSRFQSVKNGLTAITDSEGIVAIHDGVRPLTQSHTIKESFKIAAEKGNAIAAVPSKDSLRKINGTKTEAVDRTLYYLIQTPQTFQLPLIKKAFEVEESPLFTDDATVLEKAGHTIQLVEGSYDNIKITTPEDLIIAEAFLQGRK